MSSRVKCAGQRVFCISVRLVLRTSCTTINISRNHEYVVWTVRCCWGLTAIRLFQQLLVKRVFSIDDLHLSCSLIVSEGQTNKYGEGSGRIWGHRHFNVMIRESRPRIRVSMQLGECDGGGGCLLRCDDGQLLYCCFGATYSTVVMLNFCNFRSCADFGNWAVYRDVSTLLSREYSRMRTPTLQMGTSNTEAKVVCVRACRLMSLRDVQLSVCDAFARKCKMRHFRPSFRP